MDKKLSDLPIKNTPNGTEYIHILDVNDLTDSPQGTDKRTLIPIGAGATNLYLGQFLSQADLETAHPTGVNGNFAWIYDPINSIDIRAIWNGTAWFYDQDFVKDASNLNRDTYYGSGNFFGVPSDGFSIFETDKNVPSLYIKTLNYSYGVLRMTKRLGSGMVDDPKHQFSISIKKTPSPILVDKIITVLIPDIDQSPGKTYEYKSLSLVVTTDYPKVNNFPIIGIAGLIYLALDTMLQYVWQFNAYQLVGANLSNYVQKSTGQSLIDDTEIARLAQMTAIFTTALLTKLNGIATGATANSTDAFLLNRANHTGTQLASTISDLTATIKAIANNRTIYVNTNKLDTLVSGGLTEQTVLSFVIPAGTINVNNYIEILFGTLKSVTGYVNTTRLYLGTTLNARTTLIRAYSTSTNNYSFCIRSLLRLDSLGMMFFTNPNVTANQADFGDAIVTTSPPTSVSFNRNIDNFITVTIQNQIPSAISSLSNIVVKIF